MESGRILRLPESVASKIAAGEVVESPASVVKELLENSVDSGAARIILEIKAGGREMIRVTDDGSGISREDAGLVFERYATSKISRAEDLAVIRTMGFRGEALSSIAAVSHVEIVTRRKQDPAATRMIKNPGELPAIAEAGRNPGTTVMVKDLFFNTPARRKFMKSDSAELMRVTSAFTALAAAHPAAAFRYIADEKEKINLPSVLETQDRIRGLFGGALADSLLFSETADESCRVEAFFSNLDHTRNNRSGQLFFVNSRAVGSRALEQGVRFGYRDLLPPGRFPSAFIYLTIDPGEVDVNVHPTKREIRFSDEQRMVRAVSRCITEGFRRVSVPKTLRGGIGPGPAPDAPSPLSGPVSEPLADLFGLPSGGPVPETPADSPDAVVIGEKAIPRYGMLVSYFQIHNTYLLSQIKNGIILIDQHVAHERVLFERALRSIQNQEQAVVQQLLFPVTLELSPAQAERLSQFSDFFRKTGFSLRPFSGNTAVLDGIPAGLKDCPVQTVIQEMLDTLAENEAAGAKPDAAAPHIAFARSFACKAAIKAGTQLSNEEINGLVDLLFQCENPYTCPHGRPIIIRITLDELGRRFMRQ